MYADSSDEVSALVVDFGSHTTRAGYAGEDCPRVVCPSFYGYIDEPASSSSNGNGANPEGMDIDGAPPTNGDSTGKSSRKYFVGDDGPGVWRSGMEVDNFMLDGIGAPFPPSSVPLRRRAICGRDEGD